MYIAIPFAALDDFMERLDKRYEAKVRTEGGAVMAKKSRKVGFLSASSCPTSSPRWTIH